MNENPRFPGFNPHTFLPPVATVVALREALIYERVFYQTTPSLLWVITHDLPFRPGVTIVDSEGTEKHGRIEYISDSTIHFISGLALAGSAILR